VFFVVNLDYFTCSQIIKVSREHALKYCTQVSEIWLSIQTLLKSYQVSVCQLEDTQKGNMGTVRKEIEGK
jgi:hypothetical protein